MNLWLDYAIEIRIGMSVWSEPTFDSFIQLGNLGSYTKIFKKAKEYRRLFLFFM
jgi:hypothetical protein